MFGGEEGGVFINLSDNLVVYCLPYTLKRIQIGFYF
jgi:hypothetical protein